MKRRKLLQHLQRHGCTFKEGRRHTRVFNPINRRWSAVPRHPEIDSMLARGICKQLDLPSPSGN
ncbi:MAG: type II toxin-antitoxin system HicA family toxin [Planctomycetes bacterium]|nr:type II toxin-antitoxin system HicA family toxin [Planctomycetota bacterium]